MVWAGERNTIFMWYSSLGQRFAGSFITPCVLGKISDTWPLVIVTRILASDVLWTVNNVLSELQPAE
jgi:hypothetical protein